jgi:UDPglucose 6-dehydrogenase
MKICVYGLYHLGTVISSCLSKKNFHIIGLDHNKKIIKNLKQGIAPLYEPKLNNLIKKGIKNRKLFFTNNISLALSNIKVLWVSFDTPIINGKPNDKFIEKKIKKILPHLKKNTIILISSQISIGFIKKFKNYCCRFFSKKNIFFAYCPENLRLGNAIKIFLKPDRVVLGVDSLHSKKILKKLFLSITNKIEWMTIESAEMTKHAINSFLATSIIFINEVTRICKKIGADISEIERGLKTDSRIGPKAYLSAGGPLTGETLLRDVNYLKTKSKKYNLSIPLLSSIITSNEKYKKEMYNYIKKKFKNLSGIKFAFWGIAYKAGTSEIKGSLNLEICNWLLNQGAKVNLYDPFVKLLPTKIKNKVKYCHSALNAILDTNNLILGYSCAEFTKTINNMPSKKRKKLTLIDPYHYA